MVAIGCDHGGYDLKEAIINNLKEKGIAYEDMGCNNKETCDYPEKGQAVARAVALGKCKKGIVVCTTGVGISIAANKVMGIRAALCTNVSTARLCREHNNANVLALGSANVEKEEAFRIVEAFLQTEFSKEERHKRRVDQIEG